MQYLKLSKWPKMPNKLLIYKILTYQMLFLKNTLRKAIIKIGSPAMRFKQRTKNICKIK